MLLACRTSVAHWSSPFCERLDARMAAAGVQLLDLPWSEMELQTDDVNHFTPAGLRTFSDSLAAAVARRGASGRALVLADSTVDWLNESDEREGDETLRRALAARGLDATIVSQSGSGFGALRKSRRDFVALANATLQWDPSLADAHWVIVGGWNDEQGVLTEGRVHAALKSLLSLHKARPYRMRSRAAKVQDS